MTVGFPNLFMIYGPMGPFTNQPPVHEAQVDWVAGAIDHVRKTGKATIEPTAEAEVGWMDDCDEIANGTLFTKVNSWINGAKCARQACDRHVQHGRNGCLHGQGD